MSVTNENIQFPSFHAFHKHNNMVNSLLFTRLTCTLNRAIEGIAAILLILEEPPKHLISKQKLQSTIRTCSSTSLSSVKRKLNYNSQKYHQSSSSSSSSRRLYLRRQKQISTSSSLPSSPSSPVSIIDTYSNPTQISLPTTTLHRKRPRSPPSSFHAQLLKQQLQSPRKSHSRRLSLPSAGKRFIRERPSNVTQELRKDIRQTRKVNFAPVVEYIP